MPSVFTIRVIQFFSLKLEENIGTVIVKQSTNRKKSYKDNENKRNEKKKKSNKTGNYINVI